MTFLKQITLVCFISACFFSCKKDEKQADVNIYAEFIDQMHDRGIATGNILVYKEGEIIYQNSHGLRAINPKDSLTLSSQFCLASVSKQFTGMSIMKLKEAGKLEYDQKVKDILPDFPYDNITVRHLLNHVSGLADYGGLIYEYWKPEDSTKTYILGNDEIIKEFHKVSPELKFQPGEKWEYSNTGYLYLATIIEKISGQHFREFLKENIFDPLLIYKFESFELFKAMIDQVNKDVISFLFKGELPLETTNTIHEAQARRQDKIETSKEEIQNMDERAAQSRAAGANVQRQQQVVETIVRDRPKIGRNDRVTIKHVMSGENKTLKYKQAIPLITKGDWVLIED